MIVIRLTLTALLVVLAVFGVGYVWTTYFEAPWTRDARVRADIVQIASYVAGNLVELNVANNAEVKSGDVLMRIDPTDYQIAVDRADANVGEAKANVDLKSQQMKRYVDLSSRDKGAVADVQVVNSQLETQLAEASLKAAEASLAAAKNDLDRTTIVAPVDGYVTNLIANIGDYAQPGIPIMALVDSRSFRVEAFFMETQLRNVPVGATVRMRLMSGGPVLKGKVEGIARAIFDAQNISAELLQNPLPSFQWIRLAQRIPVHISLTDMPDDFTLVSGETVTVILDSAADSDTPHWARSIGNWINGLLGWDDIDSG